MRELLNKIVCGDCIEVLGKADRAFADLIFADPPFNIGYKYDKYHDKQKKENYIAWTKEWMRACKEVLKPDGSFYVAIGDKYAANIKVIADELGLFMRNWIIWHYSFGQQTKNKFALSHTHIFYFVKDEKKFTFNDSDVRVISDRQKTYRDKRANPAGKMPDDVWDEYPRLCGTFKERIDFPCQMPESLLGRIIRASSNTGDWVLDPFSGSGTTAAISAKLGRKFTGIELSKDYASESRRRVEECKGLAVEGEGKKRWTEHLNLELKWLYSENKVPLEQLEGDDFLLNLFAEKFNKRITEGQKPFQAAQVLIRLLHLKKTAALGPLNIRSVSGKKLNNIAKARLRKL